MQYIRRRIQRVSGVTIRDEPVESRDFSTASWREEWEDSALERVDPAAPDRPIRALNQASASYRERA